jgi:hypothetical protein
VCAASSRGGGTGDLERIYGREPALHGVCRHGANGPEAASDPCRDQGVRNREDRQFVARVDRDRPAGTAYGYALRGSQPPRVRDHEMDGVGRRQVPNAVDLQCGQAV